MTDAPSRPDPCEQAHSLVGRHLYRFARVEQKINQAVIKLSDLDEKAAPVVAVVDFARKTELVRESAYRQCKPEDKSFVKDTCNRVHDVNMDRRMIAHSSFEPASGGGVQFGTTVTKDGRVEIGPIWTETDFSDRCAEMIKLEADLDKLILLIKPALPFGWFSPWQDIYHRSSSAAAAVRATTEVVQPPLTLRSLAR